MLHKKIDIPKEYFYQIMTKLGSISSSIEFEDLNTNELKSSKAHSSIINRCDEVETIFTHLDEVINDQLGLKIDLYDDYKDFKKHLDYELKNSQEVIKEKSLSGLKEVGDSLLERKRIIDNAHNVEHILPKLEGTREAYENGGKYA